MRILAFAALAAFLIAAPAAAQRKSDGLSGTRVRVTAPNYIPVPVTGTVTSYTQEGIVVTDELTGDSILLPLHSVSRLDRFAGGSAASTAWYRGRLGAFLGAGLGLIVGPVSSKLTGKDMVESTLIGGAIGLTSGFAVGAIAGAASPRERWTWTLQPWGYDASLRPAPQPAVVASQPAAQPATAETDPAQPQTQIQAEPQVQP
ncbi:MAG TPA: hypothetical protein VHG93_11590 [Longimicrobium sp.]|nr:hypothetical protein [Longimicrobium sp.]